jgi:hypothetical protein
LAEKDRTLACGGKRAAPVPPIGRSHWLAATPWAGDEHVKVELDDQARCAVGRALVERKALLIERAGDTTKRRSERRAALLDLSAISSVLRKLRKSCATSSEMDPRSGTR